MMKYLTVALMGLMAMGLGSCFSSKTVTDLGQELQWLEGQWLGLGYQPDSDQEAWPIVLDVDLSKRTCRVNYPSFPCGGRWELVEAKDHAARFIEKIEDGQEKCYNGGLLIITLVDKNHLSYSFFYPGEHRLGAFSTLVRKSYQEGLDKQTL